MFLSWEKTLECVVIALFFAGVLSASSYKATGVLQSCGYSGKKFMGWVKQKSNLGFNRLVLLATMCALSCAVLALCFSFAGEWAALISLVGYVLFFILYILADKKIALRSNAALTPRFKRLYVVLILVYAIVSYFLVALLNFVAEVWQSNLFATLKYVPLCALPLLIYPVICLSNLLCKVYEVPKNNSYIKAATQKFAASKITVVGITGSFAKTTVKNFLSAMLSKKYKVLSTPRSHNTPIGIALAANKNNLDEYDVFIAEMGARNVGDIAELCKICQPDYSIITGVCPQHIQTFKSVENVIKAKGEILQSTKNKAFIAADAFEYFENFDCNKIKCNCLKNVKATAEGTYFTLTFGENSIDVKTKLLGEHSAFNFALAAEAAYEMGVSLQDIKLAIEQTDFVEHRLQLIKSNGVNVLDDGYNANVKGVDAALSVLNLFDGRKIVVTPGLVELGVLEQQENALLGAKLKGVDLAILVGETLVGAVKQGYISAGGNEENLVVKPTLFAAQEYLKTYLKPGDTVLFLNDLPDVI